MSSHPKDWKLKLKSGEIKTPFSHFAVLAKGHLQADSKDFATQAGPAIMGLQVWAENEEEASHMISILSERLNFTITGNIDVYKSDPLEPPRENPHGYNVKFTPSP